MRMVIYIKKGEPMKKVIISALFLIFIGFNFTFSSSTDETKSKSSSKCPYLNQMVEKSCPYSGKLNSAENGKGKAGECPYLMNNGNTGCPYLDGVKSEKSDTKTINRVWQEIKS